MMKRGVIVLKIEVLKVVEGRCEVRLVDVTEALEISPQKAGAILRKIARLLLDIQAALRDVHPGDAHPSRAGFQVAGEHPHNGRLTGSIVAQQAHDLSRSDIK